MDTPSGLPDPDSLQSLQRRMIANFCRSLSSQTQEGDSQSITDERVAAFPPRVRQTLQRLLVGDSEKQIARQLGVRQCTAHVYVKTIYRTFDVSSRGELMAHFVSDKWLQSSPKS